MMKLAFLSQLNCIPQAINQAPLLERRRLVAMGKAKIVKLFPYTIELIQSKIPNGKKKSSDPDVAAEIFWQGPTPQGSQGARVPLNKMRGKNQFKDVKAHHQIPCCS